MVQGYIHGLDSYNINEASLLIRSDLVQVVEAITGNNDASYIFLLIIITIIFALTMYTSVQVLIRTMRTTISKSVMDDNLKKKYGFESMRNKKRKKRSNATDTAILMNTMLDDDSTDEF